MSQVDDAGHEAEPRLSRWESRTEWPLTLAAVAFLAAYALPILNQDLSRSWRSVCETTTWVTWALFALDYAVRVSLAADRRRFIRSNLLDLVVVVLPILRPLRLLRLVTLLSVLNRKAGNSLRGRVLTYVAGAAGLVIFVAALAVLDAERQNPEANLVSFPDGLWWAATTVTTVGYGDRYPTTKEGRWIAVGLMIAGIAIIGVITAAFASWLIERVREVEEESSAATRQDVERLSAEIARLHRVLEDSARGGRDPAP